MINKARASEYLSMQCYDNFCKQYNTEDKPLRDRLRSSHSLLFNKMVWLWNQQQKSYEKNTPHIAPVDPANPHPLTTNRNQLGGYCKVSPASIYRQIQRLMEAGVITSKEVHWSGKNIRSFELYINPELMLITDVENLNPKPTSKFLNSVETSKKQAFKNFNAINLTTNSFEEHLKNSNKITPSELVNNEPSKGDNLSVATASNELGKELEERLMNTERLVRMEEKPATETENTSAKSQIFENEQLARGRAAGFSESFLQLYLGTARWFLAYVRTMLYDNRTDIYAAEWEKTYRYILQNYFNHVQTKVGMERWADQLKIRVNIAANILANNPESKRKFNLYSFPGNYLAIENNPNGFPGTKKFIDARQKQQEQRKKKLQKSLVDKLLNEYSLNPTIRQYVKGKNTIMANNPQLIDQYNARFVKI